MDMSEYVLKLRFYLICIEWKRYPAVELFRKMRGLPEFPSEQKGAGDVISHLSKYLLTIYYFAYAHPLLDGCTCVFPLSAATWVDMDWPFTLPFSATAFLALDFLPLPPPIRTRERTEAHSECFLEFWNFDGLSTCLPPRSSFWRLEKGASNNMTKTKEIANVTEVTPINE